MYNKRYFQVSPLMLGQDVGRDKLGWQQSFSCFLLLWLLLDLCVVHWLCPQYAVGELFGGAVPAVISLSDALDVAQEGDNVPAWSSVAQTDHVTEKGALLHSCMWNTQSIVNPSPLTLLPGVIALVASSFGADLLALYARLFPYTLFRPPRQV
ncbi:MAG: hypothetical protein ACUVR8_05245 [Acidobacteriota bacterium]